MHSEPEVRYTCGDCGAREGELHDRGCDMETCPFCKEQLISCECCYTELGIDCSEGTWAYHHGLTAEQDERWGRMLEEKGRIRCTRAIVLCARCGVQWPDFFRAEDWSRVIPEPFRDEVLCRRCYEAVRSFVLEAIEAGR